MTDEEKEMTNYNNKPDNVDRGAGRKSRVNFGSEAEVVSFEKNERDADEDRHIDHGVGGEASPGAESDSVKASNDGNSETF